MSRYTLATALLSLFILVVDNTRAHEGSEIDSQGGGAWSYLPIEMPSPLSGMSVDVLSLNGTMEKSIILTGGCDGPDGNVFYDEAEWAVCSSVASKVRGVTTEFCDF